MGDPSKDWFAPARLFDDGYPEGITSALRTLDRVRDVVREAVVAIAPRLTLEIGPGDAPVTQGVGRVVFLDLVPVFLRRLPEELRVQADLFAAPFAPGTFDLVVVNDVLTHIRPEERPRALTAIAALGRRVVLFNPEPGTDLVELSPSPLEPIMQHFEGAGWETTVRTFVAKTRHRDYQMRLVTAVRP
jgi:hypothetical protein